MNGWIDGWMDGWMDGFVLMFMLLGSNVLFGRVHDREVADRKGSLIGAVKVDCPMHTTMIKDKRSLGIDQSINRSIDQSHEQSRKKQAAQSMGL